MRSFLERFFIVLTCVVAASCWQSLPMKNCGGPSKILAVGYDGDVKSGAAILIKGANAKLNITFISDKEYTSAVSVVHGIIGAVPVSFPLDNANVCKNCSVACPLEAKKQYSYVPTIPVRKYYPSLTLVVKWEIKEDTKSDDLLCIEVAVQIHD